jgi:asparagine synthase (glutamine-hydrolysing)
MVRESVVSRSIADVSLEHFSLGVDSSIVSLCLAQQSSTKLKPLVLMKIFDETDKSRTVAKLNSNHHEFIISEKI